MTERTFVMIKPDGVERGLSGEIVKRFESNGLKVIGMKLIHVTEEQAKALYSVHLGKPFYDELVEYITSGPVLPMVLEGKDAVNSVRKIIGSTDPSKAEKGTVRADFGLSIGKNTVHAADSVESFEREMPVFFFPESELVEYKRKGMKSLWVEIEKKYPPKRKASPKGLMKEWGKIEKDTP
jgi:nucleoside-diphosphate kinase